MQKLNLKRKRTTSEDNLDRGVNESTMNEMKEIEIPEVSTQKPKQTKIQGESNDSNVNVDESPTDVFVVDSLDQSYRKDSHENNEFPAHNDQHEPDHGHTHQDKHDHHHDHGVPLHNNQHGTPDEHIHAHSHYHEHDHEEEVYEPAPPIVTEGKDFWMQIPERMYVDSDPEFHLDTYIIISYVLLFHIDSHILMVTRRFLAIYAMWALVGLGYFVCDVYYPILLDEPLIQWQFSIIHDHIFKNIADEKNLLHKKNILIFLVPFITTCVTFLLLSPILLRKKSIAETLHCSGDLRFFGNPFPESLVVMKNLRRVPKPSKPWTYETFVFRNMTARMHNLFKLKFWKLWWMEWVCGCTSHSQPSKRRKFAVILWLPISCVLLIMHVLPLCSIWANYIRHSLKAIFLPKGNMKKLKRCIKVALMILQFLGILVFYLLLWNFLVSFI